MRDIDYTHQQKQAQNEDKQRLLERDIIGLQTELKEENDRRVRKEHEAEEVKRANYYQQQRTAEDIKGLQTYLTDCERQCQELKNRQGDLEAQLAEKSRRLAEQERLEGAIRQENMQLKKDLTGLRSSLVETEARLQKQLEENDDLKYDNTILYEKNVQKDTIIYENDENLRNLRAEIETLRHQLEDSKNELGLEREKRKAAENNVEDLARQLRRIEEELETRVKELKDDLSAACNEIDRYKRNAEQLGYELENMRRLLQTKQDLIDQLNNDVRAAAERESALEEKVKDLEQIVEEMDLKNKKLVELINDSIYQKAESYKNKVMQRLNRSSATPNKTAYTTQQPSNFGAEPSPHDHRQASPERLKRLMKEEQNQRDFDREDLKQIPDLLYSSKKFVPEIQKKDDLNVSPYHLMDNPRLSGQRKFDPRGSIGRQPEISPAKVQHQRTPGLALNRESGISDEYNDRYARKS